jgi:hypothetical protein
VPYYGIAVRCQAKNEFFQSEQISFSTPNVKDAEEGIAIVSGAKRGPAGKQLS